MAPCISRLYLKGMHVAPVVFEVYMVAPCSSCNICKYPLNDGFSQLKTFAKSYNNNI